MFFVCSFATFPSKHFWFLSPSICTLLSLLQRVAVCCDTLRCCSVLQCVAVCLCSQIHPFAHSSSDTHTHNLFLPRSPFFTSIISVSLAHTRIHTRARSLSLALSVSRSRSVHISFSVSVSISSSVAFRPAPAFSFYNLAISARAEIMSPVFMTTFPRKSRTFPQMRHKVAKSHCSPLLPSKRHRRIASRFRNLDNI